MDKKTEGLVVTGLVALWALVLGGALFCTAEAHATNQTPDWEPFDFPPLIFKRCEEYRLEKYTTTWDRKSFSWSELADWPNAGPLDWGVYPSQITGHHSGNNPPHTKDGDRDFAYVIVDSRPLVSEECPPPAPLPPPQPVPTTNLWALIVLVLSLGGVAYWRYPRA